MASAYEEGNSLKQAEKTYRHAFSTNPQYAELTNSFAYFLISNDINVDEGMELIRPLHDKEPDNGNYLHTFGLGLFKQGELKEAREVLKKSWNLLPYYNHEQYLHIRQVEKAFASQN